jgi:hypothetical protein
VAQRNNRQTSIGRPPEFLPEYSDHAAKLCRLGATDAEIADLFGKDGRTINR